MDLIDASTFPKDIMLLRFCRYNVLKRSSRTNNHVVGASERQTKIFKKFQAVSRRTVFSFTARSCDISLEHDKSDNHEQLSFDDPKNPTVPSRLETFSGPSLYSKYVRPNFLLITAKCYWNVQLIFLGRHL